MVFNKHHTTKYKTMRSSYLPLLFCGIPKFVKGQENNTSSPLSNANTTSPVSKPSTLSPSQTPSAMWNETDYESLYEDVFDMSLTLPWGEPAFGYDSYHLSPYYNGIHNFEDIRHYG
jgi:hypothetical protein